MADALFQARLQQRELTLLGADRPLLRLALDQGGRHRLVAHETAVADAVVSALESLPGVRVLPADGGLLSGMSVRANFALALGYGQEVDEDMRRDWDQRLLLAWRLCGVEPAQARVLGRALPMQLERMERWLAGFVLQLLRPAELLVLDRAFAGLSRRQSEQLLALEAVHHEFHPFRPILFLDLDAHSLPELPACRQTVELEPLTCPS